MKDGISTAGGDIDTQLQTPIIRLKEIKMEDYNYILTKIKQGLVFF